MGKKSGAKAKIPKRVLGFKLSKGSRKDLGKLVKLIEGPEARGLAVSAASIALGYLAQRTAERKPPSRNIGGKAAGRAKAN